MLLQLRQSVVKVGLNTFVYNNYGTGKEKCSKYISVEISYLEYFNIDMRILTLHI